MSVFFVLAVIIPFSPIMAADSLTIDQCISIANENNLDLSIAKSDLHSAELGKSIAGKARLPQFRFSAGASYAPYSLKFGYDPAVSNGGEMGARIIAEQILYDGGMRSLGIHQAGLNINLQENAYSQTERDVKYNVRQTFIDLLQTQLTYASHAESTSRLSDYFDLVKRLNAAGTVGYTDLLSAQTELSNSRAVTLTDLQAISLAKYRLAQAMGTPNDTAFAAKGSLDSLLVIIEEISTPLPEIDTSKNLEARAANLDFLISQIRIRQAKSERMPSLSLTGDFGVLTSRENLRAPSPDRYNSVGYSLGISLEIPVWDWGAWRERVQQSKIESRAALDRKRLVELAIITEYRALRAQRDNAAQRLNELRNAVETSQKNYALYMAKYTDGAATAYDVLLAEQTLTDSKLSEIAALAEIQNIQAQYERLAAKQKDNME